MQKWLCIWYDLESEKEREVVEAETKEDAERIIRGWHASPPASELTIIPESEG